MPAGTITALQAQINDPRRVNVFIDNTFALGVSLETLSDERLYVGRVLNEEEFTRLEAAEQIDRATRLAAHYLDVRPRSAAELRTYLQRKEFEPDAIDHALRRLTNAGLLDDSSFARFWIENRQLCRPRGKMALRDELRRKGVAQDVINTTLDDTELMGDEWARAETLARGALRRYASAENYQTFARRMGSYLQRRGFALDTTRSIVELLWNELQREHHA
jgi:regulatory protein